MFGKTIRLHYHMVYSIFWFSMLFLGLAVVLFLRNYGTGFVALLKVAPVAIGIFLGINTLFGSEDYESEAGILQTLPISKKTYFGSKLLLMGGWITFSVMAVLTAAHISFDLGGWSADSGWLQILTLWLLSFGMSAGQAALLIVLFPVVVFLLGCLLCQGVTVLQMIGNGLGRRMKKDGGILTLTLVGLAVFGLIIFGLFKLTLGMLEAAAYGNGFALILGAEGFLLLLDVLLFLGLSRLMESRYEI